MIVLASVIPLQAVGTLLVKELTYSPYSVDFVEYYGPAAESVLAGEGPRLPNGAILTHYPPGYPFYVAGLMAVSRTTGAPLTGLIIAGNLAWNTLTVLAMFLLAYRLAGVRLAVAAGLLSGLYPPLLYLSKIAFVQVPYLAFLAWGLYAACLGHSRNRLRFFALAGGAFAIAGLLRPDALALLAMLLLYVLVFYRGRLLPRLARPAAVLGAFLLTSAPWTAYVYAHEGRLLLLGDVATSHLEGTAQADSAADDPRGIRGVKHFQELARAPLSHSLELLRRAGKAWYHTDSGRYESAALVLNLPFALLLAIGVIPALRSGQRWPAGLTFTMFLSAWGLSTLTMYLARYLATGVILASPIMATGLLWAAGKLRIIRQG